MSTPAITILRGDNGVEIAVLYAHCDGYPSSYGKALRDFLLSPAAKNANGAECLAASVVAHFKDGPYTYYLMPAGTRNANYTYDVNYDAGRIRLRVSVDEEVVFDGQPGEFAAL